MYVSYLEDGMYSLTRRLYTHVSYQQDGIYVCMCIQHGRCVCTHMYIYTTLQLRCSYSQITTSMQDTHTHIPPSRQSVLPWGYFKCITKFNMLQTQLVQWCYVLHRCIRYLCTHEARMHEPPPLVEAKHYSSRIKLNDVLEICNGIIFDSYLGLSHVHVYT